MNNPKYKIYATLLDAFADYLRSSEIYQEYWGYSEDPAKTEEQFEQEQFQSLIDRINRVPFDSEAADRGTAFNEVVDCILLGQNSSKMEIEKVFSVEYIEAPDNLAEIETEKVIALTVNYNGRTFGFPIGLCREFADYYSGGIPQVRTEAILPTHYGDVLLYGVIDELMPTSVHDIKTTSKYKAGKFLHHWQHIVYPYCLNQNGNAVSDFEYNVAQMNDTQTGMRYAVFTEHYAYVPERDDKKLLAHTEAFIEFLEANRDRITDKKVFGNE